VALAGLIGCGWYMHSLPCGLGRTSTSARVWGWRTAAAIPRSFDNPARYFRCCAPLFRMIGEHAWIVVPMRLAMLPLYGRICGLIYLIGRAIYVQRWGVWMAMVAGGVPILPGDYGIPDGRPLDHTLADRRVAGNHRADGRAACVLFGLTMGASFAVSMKTTLLLLSMGTGAVGLIALHVLSRRERISWLS